MTYEATEISVEAGSPVELYEFNWQTYYYRYTSAASPVVRLGNTFEPLPLRRSALTNSGQFDANTLRLEAFRSFPIADLFRVQPPSGVVSLVIYRRHTEDADAEFALVWSGRVLSAAWNGNMVEVECEPITVSLKRPGLRRHYQKTCPHVLYGPGCRLVASAHAHTATTFGVNGLQLTVADFVGFVDGYFAGGYIEYTSTIDGSTEFRSVVSSSTGVLVLTMPPLGLAGAGQVKAYRGCAHTVPACVSFNNLPNYGGQPYIPTKNPFGGSSIY